MPSICLVTKGRDDPCEVASPQAMSTIYQDLSVSACVTAMRIQAMCPAFSQRHLARGWLEAARSVPRASRMGLVVQISLRSWARNRPFDGVRLKRVCRKKDDRMGQARLLEAEGASILSFCCLEIRARVCPQRTAKHLRTFSASSHPLRRTNCEVDVDFQKRQDWAKHALSGRPTKLSEVHGEVRLISGRGQLQEPSLPDKYLCYPSVRVLC